MGIIQEGQKEYSFGKKVVYLAQKEKKKKKKLLGWLYDYKAS